MKLDLTIYDFSRLKTEPRVQNVGIGDFVFMADEPKAYFFKGLITLTLILEEARII